MVGSRVEVEGPRAWNMSGEIVVDRQRQHAGQFERCVDDLDVRILATGGKPVGGDERISGSGHQTPPFFFGSHFSTGPPASRHAAKPPPRCATGFSPMSCAVLAASAERKPPAQWKMNFLSA